MRLRLDGKIPRREHRKCSVPGCGRKHDSRGFCTAHYKRMKRHGTIDAPVRRRMAPYCQVPECGRPTVAFEMCTIHYQRARRALLKKMGRKR
jgi:hypothetical protein